MAILLLEINIGKPIEQITSSEDQASAPKDDDMADYQIAHRWFEAEGPGMTPGFRNAVKFGLQQHVNVDADFDDPRFRDEVKEKMLQPLRKEMQYMESAR